MYKILKYFGIFSLLFVFHNTIVFSQANDLVVDSINTHLHILFDESYGVEEIVNVNEELGIDLRNRRGYYSIDDPYNTLSDSYIFYAGSFDRKKNDVVGIYKNGEILWHSEPIIYGQGAAIVGTIDMNLDGNVEIIFAVDIWGTYQSSNDIWIFSWNGNDGNCINAKDSQEHYIPLGMSFRQFSMDDLDGDGILEIRSHQAKDGTIAWSWNGQAYGRWETTPIVPFEVFQSATNAEADIKCVVTKIDSQYLFDFEIYNRSNSIRRIQNIHIDHGLFDTLGYAPFGWKFIGRFENSPISWNYNFNNTASLIAPGEKKDGFGIKSIGLPKISNFYIQSERGPSYYRGSDALIKIYEDIINNSFIGKIIAPYPPPNPFIPINFIDTIKTYCDSSYALGWIQNEQTRDKYNNYFANAKSYLNQYNNNAAKSELQKVLTDCNADSSSVLTSEAYALLYFNTDYLIKQIPEGEPGLPVKLEDSQGNLLQGGSLQYYDSGWKDAIDNGDGTFTVQTEKSTVSLKMNYAGASQQLNNVTVGPDTAVFQTVNTTVKLLNSQGAAIDTGTVKYYASGWKDLGTTVNGEVTKELLSKEYSFRMSYGGASIDKKQDIGTDATVVFQTVNAKVQLKDSQGNLLDGGSVKYYASGWKDFGTATNGEAAKELLPKEYSFRMNYGGASQDKKQNIGVDPAVVFQTVNASVQLKDSQGNLLSGGIVQYYASGWKDFGTATNGEATKELLPKEYSFRMRYGGASLDQKQDIGIDGTVIFQTVKAEVQLKDSQGNLLGGGQVQYYAAGWKDFGTAVNGEVTKELLPKEYSFRMNYGGASIDEKNDISVNQTLVFNTINTIISVSDGNGQPINNALASYYASGWKEIGNTINGEINKELLPKNYSFRVNNNGVNQDKQQDISSNNIVEFTFE